MMTAITASTASRIGAGSPTALTVPATKVKPVMGFLVPSRLPTSAVAVSARHEPSPLDRNNLPQPVTIRRRLNKHHPAAGMSPNEEGSYASAKILQGP